MRFQPIYSVRQDDIIGYEVLSKLSASEDCEHYFSSLSIGEHLKVIIGQLKYLWQALVGCHHFINVPVAILVNRSAIDTILEYSSINITIELQDPESVAKLDGNEKNNLIENMMRLRMAGFAIWLDDLTPNIMPAIVGLGFEFNGIKVDKNIFWQQIEHPELLCSFIHCCHFLSDHVLVEGIETFNQRQLAIKCGADYLQGYYWPEQQRSFSYH
ncbi:EAL domain-containing protein [Buttiauxella sp. B2]|nr:EAL domain-containing protein [Buttiauxella sp. B2]